MEKHFTPDQSAAWYQLFESAPVGVLAQAQRSSLIDSICLHEGRDLLFALMSRPPKTHKLMMGENWWDEERAVSSVNQVYSAAAPRLAELEKAWAAGGGAGDVDHLRPVVDLCEALLNQPGVDPLRRARPCHPDAPVFGREASALELALAANLVPIVEQIQRWARAHGRAEDCRAQLMEVDHEGLSPLHRAASSNRQSLIEFLIEQGIDPNIQDDLKRTPMFHVRFVKTFDLLFESGARVDAQWREASLIRHWAALKKRNEYGGEWAELIERVQLADPAKKIEAATAQAWIWFDSSAAQFLQSYVNGASILTSQWNKGWEENMIPALSDRPIHEFRRRVSSGMLRGESSLLSEMGAVWMKAKTTDRVWFGLLESPHSLFGARPVEIRKGLSDWGVFALGAARHLRWKIATPPDPANQKLYDKDRAELVMAMDKVASLDEWENHMIQAAALLQRPKNSAVWRDVAQCFSAHLENLTDQEKKLRVPPTQQMASRLSLIEGAMASGLRWPTVSHPVLFGEEKLSMPAAPVALLNTYAQALEAFRKEGPQIQKLKDQWMRVALGMVADTVEFGGFASLADSQVGKIDLKEFVRLTMPKMVRLGARLPADETGALRKRLDSSWATLVAWEPSLFLGLEAQRLEASLPPASPARSSPRSRM